MKKIVVTGGTGLLGVPLVKKLKETGYTVFSLGYSKKANYQMDLTKEEVVHGLFDRINPNIIINLAALTGVDECERNIFKAYLLNVRIVENIVSWCRKNSKTHLIQMSTDQVYDNTTSFLATEQIVNIKNVYALTKYTAELLAKQVNATIIRTNFFGRSQTEGRASFSDWLIESFKNKRPIKLFTDVYFSPVHMDTLIFVITKMINENYYGVLNVGSHDGLSKMEFARYLAKVLDLDDSNAINTTAEKHLQAYRPRDMRMNSCKVEWFHNINLHSLKEEIEKLKDDQD